MERKRTRRDIKPGNPVWVASTKATQFADRIREQGRAQLLCEDIDRSTGATLVIVRMPDGSPFLNGEPTLAIAKKVIVPNPPSEDRA